MIKLKESVLDQIISHIITMELPDFIVIGVHINSPILGELKHSQEIMTESLKYSKVDKDKQKIRISIELEIQEK